MISRACLECCHIQARLVDSLQVGSSLGRNVEGPIGIWTESECRLPLESAGGQKTLLRRDAAFDAFHEICLEGGEFRCRLSGNRSGPSHRQHDRVSNLLGTYVVRNRTRRLFRLKEFEQRLKKTRRQSRHAHTAESFRNSNAPMIARLREFRKLPTSLRHKQLLLALILVARES